MSVKPRDRTERDLVKLADDFRAKIQEDIRERHAVRDELSKIRRLASQQKAPPGVELWQWQGWLKRTGLWVEDKRR